MDRQGRQLLEEGQEKQTLPLWDKIITNIASLAVPKCTGSREKNWERLTIIVASSCRGPNRLLRTVLPHPRSTLQTRSYQTSWVQIKIFSTTHWYQRGSRRLRVLLVQSTPQLLAAAIKRTQWMVIILKITLTRVPKTWICSKTIIATTPEPYKCTLS